ncbi:transcriptional regulator with XRE-family HTH domain [Evansella vedderi]|uniref:Transcriptional regulator with XRE-family HTH domain n=1 Tax=Evansella vedderi TaxID=38282 RepID=A0ABT9ZXB4_9BACI|nr:helix-turn-helix transcriptional regulator [Evansella vedderi]MDQ0255575.1 transcriptional regulator with XRE-family HTH domain [Evansella vedderi]
MIGNRLKALRLKKQLTQDELSYGIISPSYISQFENDKKAIPRYIAKDLAKKLDVSVDYLIGEDLQKEVSELKIKFVELFNLINEKKYTTFEQELDNLKKEHNESMNHPDIRTHVILCYLFIEFKKKNFNTTKQMISELKDDDIPIEGYPLMILYRVKGGIEYSKYNYERSLEYFKKSIDIAIAKKCKEHLGNIYRSVGTCYALMRSYYKAVNSFNLALKCYQKTANIQGQVSTHINLGNSLSDIFEEEEALEQYHNALSLVKFLNDPHLEAKLEFNISLVNFKLGNAEPLRHLNKAINLYKETDDRNGLFRAELLRCKINLSIDDLNEVRNSLFSMLYKVNEINNPNILADYYRTFGDYFYANEYIKEYESYYKKSIEYYKKANRLKDVSKAYLHLAKKTKDDSFYKYSAIYANKMGGVI